jgi:hypothetical protein
MAQSIIERILDMAVFEGHVDYELKLAVHGNMDDTVRNGQKRKKREKSNHRFTAVDIIPTETEVHGHSLYSRSSANFNPTKYPAWTTSKWHPARLLGLGKLVRGQIDADNAEKRKGIYKAMVLDQISESLEGDLHDGVSC